MKILIEDYNPVWAEEFLNEKSVIASALYAFDPIIEHIGSTAVPGLCAKPTVDILVGLSDARHLDQSIPPMVASGFTYFKKYEPEMPYRRMFSRLIPLTAKAPPQRIDIDEEFVRGLEFFPRANIHIIEKDTDHYRRHLAFRDYLRSHPDVRDEYCRLKRSLSGQEFKDTNDYNDAKDSFVKKVESLALTWYGSQFK